MEVYYCIDCAHRYGYPSELKDWSWHINNAKLKCSRCKCTPLADAFKRGAPDDAILTILAANFKASKTRDTNNSFPLHEAINYKFSENSSSDEDSSDGDCKISKNKFSDEVMLAVLAANKEAAKVEDNHYGAQLLPLHRALKQELSNNVLLALLKANKNAARHSDEYGDLLLHSALNSKVISDTPLQMAIQSRTSDEVIISIFAAYKDAVKIQGLHGLLPLHDAIESKCSDKVILTFLNEYKEAAKEKGRYGQLPLLRAIKLNLSDTVILTLLKANKDATKVEERNDSTLYNAIESKCSDEVILTLLDANKEASRTINLHRAMELKLSNNVILALLKANEDSDKTRHAFFHSILVEGTASDELCASFAKNFPNILKMKYSNGNMALHLALSLKKSPQVVLSILQANKEAAFEESAAGDLPLHQAIKNQYSENVIMDIFSAYPCSAMIRCSETGMLPLHLSAASSASPLFVEALIREYPEALDIMVDQSYPRDLITSKLPVGSIKLICKPYLEWKKIISAVNPNDESSAETPNVAKLMEEVTKLSDALIYIYKNLVPLKEMVEAIKTHLLQTPKPISGHESNAIEIGKNCCETGKSVSCVNNSNCTVIMKSKENADSLAYSNVATKRIQEDERSSSAKRPKGVQEDPGQHRGEKGIYYSKSTFYYDS
jgi:hypothetical protein